MSSANHLTVAQTNETRVNKRHSSFNLRTTPSVTVSSDSLHSPSSKSNSNYLHHVNVEPARKQSIAAPQNASPRPSLTGASLNVRRKLSAISLPVPWHKRNRSPSDDKSSTDLFSKHSQQQQQEKSHNPRKMSRDRLLTLDRLFSSVTQNTQSTNDDEQISPLTESTALDLSMRSNEKPTRPMRENGYLHNSSHLMTR